MDTPRRLTIISGGPGVGKTQRLVEAVSGLSVEERRKAVVLTVSASAARELRSRLAGAVASPVPPCWAFDALANHVFREVAMAGPETLQESDRRSMLAWMLESSAAADGASDRIKRWAKGSRAAAEDVSAAIGLLQRSRISADEFAAFASDDELLSSVAGLYDRYLKVVTETGLSDFDGRNLKAVEALENRPFGTSRSRLFFVDEAQELDALQVRMLALMAGQNGRITLCVDSVQRSRMYRGAVPNVASAFEKAMNAKAYVETLDGSSCSGIDRIASRWKFAEGVAFAIPEPDFIIAREPDDEADRIATLLNEASGSRAVLTRSAAGASVLKAALLARGIPVSQDTDSQPLAARFVRDALTLLSEPQTDDEDAVQEHARAVSRLARQTNTSPEVAVEWREQARSRDSLSASVHAIAVAAGFLKNLAEDIRDGAAQAYGRLMDSLEKRECAWRISGGGGPLPPERALADLRGLYSANGSIDVVTADDDDDANAAQMVDVLPAQRTAGRHWDNVIVARLQDGEFPSPTTPSPFIPAAVSKKLRDWLSERNGEQVALGRFERGDEATREEERRLFLTAVSRARKQIVLSCHLEDKGQLTAPSWFFQGSMPDGTTLADTAPRGWRCVLKDFLPVTPAGISSCEECPIARCFGRDEKSDSVLELNVKADSEPAPEPSGEAALLVDLRFSATALNEWFKCPRRFYLNNVLKLKTEEADNLFIGSLVHAILKDFNETTPRSRATLMTAMEAAFSTDETKNKFSSLAAWLLAQRRIKAALEVFWTNIAGAPDYEAEMVEAWIHPFEVPDNAGGKHKFSGKVDLAVKDVSGLKIVDYKTGRPEDNIGKMVAQWPAVTNGTVGLPDIDADVQMPLYAAALEAGGRPVANVVHHYVTVSSPAKGKRYEVPVVDEVSADEMNSVRIERGDLEVLLRFFGDTAREAKLCVRYAAEPRSGECGAYNRPCPFAGVCDVKETADE